MRCFYHTDIALPMRALQQPSQLPQSLTTDTRRLRDTHEPASGCIEHPLRNGQRPPGRLFLLQSTVKNRFAALSYRGVDRNVTTEPRMPRISENTELGNVGLVLLACIIPGAGIAHWTDAPRMRCTLTRSRRIWRPDNPRKISLTTVSSFPGPFLWLREHLLIDRMIDIRMSHR